MDQRACENIQEHEGSSPVFSVFSVLQLVIDSTKSSALQMIPV